MKDSEELCNRLNKTKLRLLLIAFQEYQVQEITENTEI